ncbi:MAG: YggT family protein [Pseudomonadota bacterium]
MNALIFIVKALASLFLLVLLLRFWLPMVKADFRNPIAQAILKITSPLIIPIRRVIPSIGRIDTATVIVTFAVQYLVIWFEFAVTGVPTLIGAIAYASAVKLVLLSLQLFMFAILIYVILSWVAPGTYNPATNLVSQLVYPILGPFSSLIPRLGGIDITPIIVIILLQASMILVMDLTGVRF